MNNSSIDKISKTDLWVKLLLLIISLIIVGRVVIHYFDAKYHSVVMAQQELVVQAADSINLELSKSLTALKILSADQEIRLMEVEKEQQLLQSVVDELGFLNLAVVGSDGTVISEITNSQQFIPVRNREYNVETKDSVSNRVVPGELNKAYIKLSVPIANDKGIQAGMLVATVPLSNISKIVQRQTMSQENYLFVIDRQANFIYHPMLETIYKNEALYQQLAMLFFRQNKGYYEGVSELKQTKQLFVYTAIDDIDWRVVIAVPVSHVYTQILHKSMSDIKILTLLIVCIVLLIVVLNQSRKYKQTMDAFHMDRLISVNQIAAGIAHEIRNPLTSIKGFIQLILLHKNQNPPKEYLELILSELERINKLLEEFRSLSRPVKAPVFTKIDLVGSLESVLLLMQSQFQTKKVQYNLLVKQKCSALADGEQIKQVWMNIIRNALDAVSEGGAIKIEISCEGAWAAIAITDNGIGISQKLFHKIGTPFMTTKDSGTGLGLFMCYNIVAQHGGKITVTSHENQGTTFIIYLPCAE